MNAQLEQAVQNLETAMAEYDQKGMMRDDMTKEDENSIYEMLKSECAVRDSCGCKKGATEPVQNLIEERLNAINSFGDPVPPAIRKSKVGCERETITDLLSRRIDMHTLELASNGDEGSRTTTDSFWGELKDFCPGSLPETLHEFLNPEGFKAAQNVGADAAQTSVAAPAAAVAQEPAAVAAPTIAAPVFNACGSNRYRTPDGSCASLTVCAPSTQYEISAPTTTTDRECAALTVCGPNQFESRAPTATTDRQCMTRVKEEVVETKPIVRARGGMRRR